jgi:hypothetical protein
VVVPLQFPPENSPFFLKMSLMANPEKAINTNIVVMMMS